MNDFPFAELYLKEAPTTFYKGEFLPIFQTNKREIAYIKKGRVSLMRSDEEGNLVFLEEYKEDDIFSKLWIYNEMNDLFIECNTDCEIYFLDFSLSGLSLFSLKILYSGFLSSELCSCLLSCCLLYDSTKAFRACLSIPSSPSKRFD